MEFVNIIRAASKNKSEVFEEVKFLELSLYSHFHPDKIFTNVVVLLFYKTSINFPCTLEYFLIHKIAGH